MSTDGSTPQDFRFQIAPRNGRAERLVIALTGDQEIHRDLLNPDLDRDRRNFLRRLEEIVNLPEGELSSLATDLVAAADEAEEILAQATATQSTSNTGRRSQASLLVDLVDEYDGIELFHDAEGLAYARLDRDGHRETWPLRRKGLRSWLAREFFLQHGKVPGSQAMQDALNVIEGRALYEGEENEVHVRFANLGDTIYVDLCDPLWRVVEITTSGWNILTDAPVRFCRHRGMLALPEPQPGGSMNQLHEFLNVTEQDWPLLLGWLAAAARPTGPFPLLGFNGEQGSAKSTATRCLRQLIDPNTAALRSEPREVRDLVIAANNSWVVAFDNLSFMPAWLSDALCRLATGGGFATRELYSDAEEILFDAKRPVIINGIGDVITRGDLLDRAIVLNLEPIPLENRRTEREFWQDFDRAYPTILGALYTAISTGLRNLPAVSLERLPRMADFATWVVATEPALEIAPGAFMERYSGNRESIHIVALEGSPIGLPLLRFVRASGTGGWSGTATELLEVLENQSQVSESLRRRREWPGTAQRLGNALRRIAPHLRGAGVDVQFQQSGQRLIHLRTAEQSAVQGVQHGDPPFGSRGSPMNCISDGPQPTSRQEPSTLPSGPSDALNGGNTPQLSSEQDHTANGHNEMDGLDDSDGFMPPDSNAADGWTEEIL